MMNSPPIQRCITRDHWFQIFRHLWFDNNVPGMLLEEESTDPNEILREYDAMKAGGHKLTTE